LKLSTSHAGSVSSSGSEFQTVGLAHLLSHRNLVQSGAFWQQIDMSVMRYANWWLSLGRISSRA